VAKNEKAAKKGRSFYTPALKTKREKMKFLHENEGRIKLR
jgi:hypothetical protein